MPQDSAELWLGGGPLILGLTGLVSRDGHVIFLEAELAAVACRRPFLLTNFVRFLQASWPYSLVVPAPPWLSGS